MAKKVAIIDYGMCNLDSIRRAVQECGGDPVVTDRERDVRNSAYVILPGVGAFPNAMENLRLRHLPEILNEHVVSQEVPFLGICLGMQLMASKSNEIRETEGLGWIEGEVRRMQPTSKAERIPHIGWNEVDVVSENPLLKEIPSGSDFYFVHSFHFHTTRREDVVATTAYAGGFVSAVNRNWLFGVQFHPEKSQRLGFQLLRNFLDL